MLSNMGRMEQVDMISMYNSMKTDLMEHLSTFAKEGKVVKLEDIQKIFKEMNNAKRRKLDLPPPDTCK